MEARMGTLALALWSLLVILFLWIPLAIILVYAFNTSNIQSWPIPGFTLQLVPRRLARPGRALGAVALAQVRR